MPFSYILHTRNSIVYATLLCHLYESVTFPATVVVPPQHLNFKDCEGDTQVDLGFIFWVVSRHCLTLIVCFAKKVLQSAPVAKDMAPAVPRGSPNDA